MTASKEVHRNGRNAEAILATRLLDAVERMKKFRLAKEFKKRIVSVWGKKGSRWLNRLPSILAACAEKWELTIESPVPILAYNFLVYAVTAEGASVVLKIGVPCLELTTEINALRVFRGKRAAALLDADPQVGALLLKRVLPGKPLSAINNDDEATEIGARLIRDIPATVPSEHQFPSIADWAMVFDRLRVRFNGNTGPLPRKMAEKAERLFKDLQTSSTESRLLHGDLHHDNILFDDKENWLAIDPKGATGDPAYEAARFQHNPKPGFLAMNNPENTAKRRLDIMASILSMDKARLSAWAFFDAVISTCWSIEENDPDWQYGLRCADILDHLSERFL